MKKVLTIVYDLGAGGTQRAAQNFALAYKREGFDSRVLTLLNSGPRENFLKENEIKVFLNGAHEACVYDEVNSWGPDLIHIHRWGHCEDFISKALSSLKNDTVKIIETNVFSQVDDSKERHLTDLHLHLSKWCLYKWGIDAKKLDPSPLGTVFPYLVDQERFFKSSASEVEEMRSTWNIPKGASVLGRIGQRSEGKWETGLFDIFQKILEIRPDTFLVLIGAPLSYDQMIKGLPLFVQKKIIDGGFLKTDEELRAAYSAFDLFVHWAEIGESFGMVLAESLLCETPVVTMATPLQDNSQGEVIGHRVGGVVASNKSSFINASLEIMNDSDLKSRYGKMGREHIIKNFSIKEKVPKLIEIVNGVLDNTRASGLESYLLDLERPLFINKKEKLNLVRASIGKYKLKEILYIHYPYFYRLLQKIKMKLFKSLGGRA